MGEKTLKNFCSSLYDVKLKEHYEDYQTHMSKPVAWNTCPYPAGSNEVTNYAISDQSILPAYLPGNEKWKVEMRFLRKDVILGGYNIYAILRDEKSILGWVNKVTKVIIFYF